jgi:hypothetical protein
MVVCTFIFYTMRVLFESLLRSYSLVSLTVFLILLSIWVLIWQVGVIGNLVHSSVNIKKEVLSAGALQPVIGLLRCLMIHLFELCINLIRHITTDVYFLL